MKKLYLDKSYAPEKRAADLVERLDVAELVVQMRNLIASQKGYYSLDADGVYLHSDFTRFLSGTDAVGSLQCLTRCDFWTNRLPSEGYTRRNCARIANCVQEYAIGHSRWQIPLLLFDDCRHGLPAMDGTVFPVGIAQGAAFSPELQEKIARHIGREMRRVGVHVSVGPNLNLACDPRWSRMEECYGEDPYLSGILGAAYIRGMQSKEENGTLLAAAAMHFIAAMGHSENGLDARPVNIGAALTEQILRPFGMGARAGALGGMASYSSLDGVPCHANRKILTDYLRRENNFSGFVEADANGIYALKHENGISGDPVECAALAIRAGLGVDLFAPGGDYYRVEYMQSALERGLIQVETLRQLVHGVLVTKFALGLFENPYVDVEQTTVIGGHDLALQAAKESMTLLKNQDNLLPLNPQATRKIAVIGAHADHVFNLLGDYTPFVRREQVSTIVDGIKNAAPHWQITYARGCDIKTGTPEMLDEALEAARHAEVILLTLGGSSNRYGQEFNAFGGGSGGNSGDGDCGEGLDRATLELSPAQMDLFRALRQSGKALIVALVHGRPCCIEEVAQQADAIVDLWYPGEAGGEALAQLLFGMADFRGRLPISIPRHAGQLPVCYHTQRPRRRDYVEMTSAPLWSFGYGLSYASVAYLEARLDADTIKAGETPTLQVVLENSSDRVACETVQVYIFDEYSSRVKPLKELCAVKKVEVPPHTKMQVVLPIPPEAMQTLQADGSKVVESGDFVLTVGDAERSFLNVRFRVE